MRDEIYALGIFLTFLLGGWNIINNIRNSKKTSFINTVTAERVKWIQSVRENISSFCGLTYNWTSYIPEQENITANNEQIQKIRDEQVEKVDKLRHLIQLQLNPKNDNDKDIIRLLKIAITQTDPLNKTQLKITLEELVEATQKMLKAEWDKVIAESKKGDLKEAKEKEDSLLNIIIKWIKFKIQFEQRKLKIKKFFDTENENSNEA